MPQAISYIRFSSGKQAYGSSQERQQQMIGSWLERHPDFTLSAIKYKDLGRSAWKGDHLEHGFGQLLKAIDEGVIRPGDAILIEAMDRAGRLKPMDMLPLIAKIVDAGVTIHTLADHMSYDTHNVNKEQLWMLVAKIQQAYEYSQELSRRLKASYVARRQKAKDGLGVNRRVPVWLTKDRQIDSQIAPYIVQAFEDYASGLGERRILRKIRGKHPAFTNLNGSTIKRWFVNKTAIGYWNDIPDVYPAVVDKELFYRVQERIKSGYKPASSPTRYLLSGLVKCGECGSNMNVKKHKDRAATLNCSRRARLGDEGCPNSKTFPKQVLEHIRVTTSISFVEKGLRSQQLSASKKRLVEIDGELDEIRIKLGNLAKAIAASGPIPEFQEQTTILSERRESLEREKLVLDKTETPLDMRGVIVRENELLDDDPMKLNSVLQAAGYEIRCFKTGKIIVSGEEKYPWEYLGFNRQTGFYSASNLGEQIKIPMITEEMRPLFAPNKGPGKVSHADTADDYPWADFKSIDLYSIDESGNSLKIPHASTEPAPQNESQLGTQEESQEKKPDPSLLLDFLARRNKPRFDNE